LKGKHLIALGKDWERQAIAGKLKPSTIQGQFSVLRVFARWIGKDGMVEATHKYVDQALVKRSSVCSHDLSWSAQGVDVTAKPEEISQKDPRVGLQLWLELESGLRAKEAMMIRPYLADKGAYLDVSVGTKGGRPRAVPINTPEQRALLDEAKAFAATKDSSTSDPNKSLAQWKNHYYYILSDCAISQKYRLTAHALRHAYANNRYKERSGQDSPVRGGKLVNREDDRAARLQVAEELGHSRETVTTHYLGRDKGKT
jgi:integrase